MVVVTHRVPTEWIEAHPGAPFHFVTDGVEAAVKKAQAIAGERTVAVTAGTIADQCLELGLLDDLSVDDFPLDGPSTNVQGDRVTHLLFPVDNAAKEATS